MYEKIKNITSLIRNKISVFQQTDEKTPEKAPEKAEGRAIPSVGVILGSGLETLADHIQNPLIINYSDLPNFPQSTVEGHQGCFVCGKLGQTNIIAMKGRVHFYEGYSMEQVVMPIRVLAMLGVKTVIVSNAAGGLNTQFSPGDLMLITDHINMMPNPLIGKNDDRLGTRFPSMHNAYDHELRCKALDIAQKMNVKLKQGVYLGVTGPSYETPAEYKFFRQIGASAVGMSTVPEVIAARHMGIRILGFSMISNVVGEDAQIEASHQEVQQVGAHSTERLTTIVKAIIDELD